MVAMASVHGWQSVCWLHVAGDAFVYDTCTLPPPALYEIKKVCPSTTAYRHAQKKGEDYGACKGRCTIPLRVRSRCPKAFASNISVCLFGVWTFRRDVRCLCWAYAGQQLLLSAAERMANCRTGEQQVRLRVTMLLCVLMAQAFDTSGSVDNPGALSRLKLMLGTAETVYE